MTLEDAWDQIHANTPPGWFVGAGRESTISETQRGDALSVEPENTQRESFCRRMAPWILR